jgi:hypothetical protein
MRLLLALAAFLLAVPQVAAQTTYVVTPNVYTNVEGPGSNSILIRHKDRPHTDMIILSSTQLTGLLNRSITGVTYRLTYIIPGPYPLVTTTWANYTIRMGPSVTPSALTTTFLNNFTGTPTTVRTGPLTVAPFSWPTGFPPAPSPWGIEIPFTTPYVYTGGDLAFMVTHPGSDNPDQGNSLLNSSGSASPGNGIDFNNLSANSDTATIGTRTNFSTVLRFSSVAASVPEPGTLFLCGVLLTTAGLGLWWRRRRTTLALQQGVAETVP